MSQEIHYLETGSQDPFYNLAFEETVLRSRRSGEYLLLWQNDNTIVIGQNQNAEEEINHAFVEAHGIRVVRRMTRGRPGGSPPASNRRCPGPAGCAAPPAAVPCTMIWAT